MPSIKPNGAIADTTQTFQISTATTPGLVDSQILFTLDDSDPDANGLPWAEGGSGFLVPDGHEQPVVPGSILRARTVIEVPASLTGILGSLLVSDVATPYRAPLNGNQLLFLFPADLSVYPELYANTSFWILFTDDGSTPDRPHGLSSAEGGNGTRLDGENGWYAGQIDSSKRLKYARYMTDLEGFYMLCKNLWGQISFCDIKPPNTEILEAAYTFVDPGLPQVSFSLPSGSYPSPSNLALSIPGQSGLEIWYTTAPEESLSPGEPFRGGPNSKRYIANETITLEAGFSGTVRARSYDDPDGDGVLSAGSIGQRDYQIAQ